MATIWHDRLAVEPCKVVIWYDHFWLAGAQCCFDSPKCVVQATLFSGDVSRFPCCMCICVRISLVRVHCAHPQWSGPRLRSVLLRKGCVCVCTFVLVKLTHMDT